LLSARDEMEKAITNLDRAAVHRTDLEKAKSLLRLGLEDVRQALAYADKHRGGAPVSSSAKPDFTPPPPPKERPLLNMMLYMTIGNLSAAYDGLNAAPGGDLGGLRARANEHIVAAVQELIAVIKATPTGRGRGGGA
jgi:hypothetical protein